MPCDVFVQHKIHRSLSDQTLRLILLDLVGGYQTGTVKAIWDSTQSDKCEFCGAVDNHMHRQLQCPDFAYLRANHSQAVEYLQSNIRLADHNGFYTDGTCDLPREPNCCRAAW